MICTRVCLLSELHFIYKSIVVVACESVRVLCVSFVYVMCVCVCVMCMYVCVCFTNVTGEY